MSETPDKDKNAAKIGAILAAAAIVAPLTLAAEGKVLHTAPDPVGIPTACYGHAGAPAGKTYTDEQCVQIAVLDLAKAGEELDGCLTRSIPLKVRAAFTDFTFNGGSGLFCKSSMAVKANAGDLAGSCAALSLYVYADHKPLPGLVKRRGEERALCEAGIAEGASAPPVAAPGASAQPAAPPPAKPTLLQRVRGWFA